MPDGKYRPFILFGSLRMETLLRDIVSIVAAGYPLAVALTWCVAVALLVSGIDDVLIDLAYWFQRIFRNRHFTQHERIPLEDLHASPEKLIAVFVPTWREESVLEQMLTRACESIDYTRYDIFVGVYPNDPRTLEKARNAAGRFPQIHVVIGGHAGPSSKAENLNEIFEGMLRYENRTGVRYELIVLHDAEDVIHPQSLRAFNVFIPRYDMVQIPVFPLPAPKRTFIHWVWTTTWRFALPSPGQSSPSCTGRSGSRSRPGPIFRGHSRPRSGNGPAGSSASAFRHGGRTGGKAGCAFARHCTGTGRPSRPTLSAAFPMRSSCMSWE
ncbi:MAG: nrfB [Bacteroidetes bacterium]|nr:nrfB [Bacteroidota bacterium]